MNYLCSDTHRSLIQTLLNCFIHFYIFFLLQSVHEILSSAEQIAAAFARVLTLNSLNSVFRRFLRYSLRSICSLSSTDFSMIFSMNHSYFKIEILPPNVASKPHYIYNKGLHTARQLIVSITGLLY